ncbi:Spy/CpxP family protein refolding chaperone [Variovorax saccharolyticus]|uniref:Spy/CpxP family protein refolding chaperone n=1 Tax=Variovorax saccharolyticus TaxID=3053516 RepID=UPI0025764E76|nr:Spy/CpxP family protein refolding chaperone [Variovorax sp. J22R187]MDM0021563.1 Spy/CpxP family protein refolding chaperone [Variovorax sp. J22R187]
MIPSRKSLLWAGLLASATFASSGAFAQAPLTAPPPAAAAAQPGAQAPAKPQHPRADRAERAERMQAHRTQRLAALKEKLKLTPAQESAWSSFTTAQQPPARPDAAQREARRAEFAKLTTPQRLDRMQARQAERSAMFAKRADATRSFYAALTPEQQKTFDAESMARFGQRGHGGHGGPGGHHHGGQPPARS